MPIKTLDLTGKKLRWAVAHALGLNLDLSGWLACHQDGETFLKNVDGQLQPFHIPHYEEWWEAAGPIIKQEGISWHCGNKSSWHAYAYGSAVNYNGPTPLVAAMRCYVASKLGDIVDIPEVLCEDQDS